MKTLVLVLLAAMVGACQDKTTTAMPSSSTSAPAAQSAVAPVKETTYEEVLANAQKLAAGRVDAEGAAELKGDYEAATPAVRACVAAAKSNAAWDACGPMRADR